MSGPTQEQVSQWVHVVFGGGARCVNEAFIEFAALAYAAGQAAEREECAKVAESAEIPIAIDVWMGTKKALTAATAIGISAAIRARGNNGK